MSIARLGGLSLAVAATLALMVSVADARVSSGGSRGNRTFNTPPATNTAPKPAAPIERSMTQPGTSKVAQGPNAAAPAAAPSRFGGGFGGLLMGGLLGAGLFGLLSGSGLFGGLGGFASFLGLLLQVALIAGIAYLVIGYFRNRNQPALARASQRARQWLAARHAQQLPARHGRRWRRQRRRRRCARDRQGRLRCLREAARRHPDGLCTRRRRCAGRYDDAGNAVVLRPGSG